MLKSLSIENYALIDSLNIDFDNGLSVITGETGAGKSIILGALSLILGQRAEAKQIKQGESKCTIEGVFDISAYSLESIFEKFDWVYDEKECILRREIWTNGKSRAFVNDSPVYLSDLKELGIRLIDIHSQHQNLLLNDDAFQLRVVDLLAETETLRKQYAEYFKAWKAKEKELAELHELNKKNKEERDYLEFQFTALSDANLQPDEQNELETELNTITHAEEIKSNLFGITNLLADGEQQNILAMLKEAIEKANAIDPIFSNAEDLNKRLESAYIELKDIAGGTSRLFDEIEFDSERQHAVEERLSLIYELQQKHSASTVSDLLELQNRFAEKLQTIDYLDEKIDAINQEMELQKEKAFEKAQQISDKRKSAIPTIEKSLTERLKYLGIPHARFECRITKKPLPDITGCDNIQFYFSANKSSEAQPVSEIASGGEISRLMLCIKSLIAKATTLPSIIFDEIDTGTSGEIADKMGRVMREMSQKMQVIAITHLPQIASKGVAHYNVYKQDSEHATHTNIKKLSEDEQIRELARMLSGEEISAQAIENARVMLSEASK